MKKTLSVLALLIALLSLSTVVLAEGKTPVRTVTATSDLPVSGKPWSVVEESNVKIIAVKDGAIQVLQAPLEFSLESTMWYDNSTGEAVALKENEVFISGRSYTLSLRIALFQPDLVIDNTTSLFINGKNASVTAVQEGQMETVYEISSHFVCTPNDIAPKVTLKTEGVCNKEYDGKSIKLSAEVEKTDGIEYRYEWYRDGLVLEGKDQETLEVRNVAESGSYHCKVFAKVASDLNENSQFTETGVQSIVITPHPVTVQIEDAEKNLFDQDPAFTYTVMGEIYDKISGYPTRTAGEDIGSYLISPGTLSFADTISQNYLIQFRTGTLTILNVEDLPFSAVATLADLSYISGEGGAKIRVSASKGTLPQGAILSLSFPQAEAQKPLEELSGKPTLKSFSVSVMDENGKAVSLPKYGTLRLQIPLTEQEEASQKVETIQAGFFGEDAQFLETKVSVSDVGVTYLTVEIKRPGTVSLFAGEEKTPVVSSGTSQGQEEEGKESGGFWLWLVIGLLTLAALCAIVLTVIWTKKNRAEEEKVGKGKKKSVQKPVPETPLDLTLKEKEKERIRRIADEMNALPPVPQEKAEEKSREKEQKNTKRKVISFEDLEEE